MDRTRIRKGAASVLALLLLSTGAEAGVTSTTTTTEGTTTTTMFEPVDVTGGGDFEGGFPAGSFDSYSFTLDGPQVLVAEITNGAGGCPGDSFVELRQLDAPGNCMGMYGDELPCIAFDDDSGIASCSKLAKHIAAPGTYEIRVRHRYFQTIVRYVLHVDFVATECGNGDVEVGEECDDGNNATGDCCAPDCRLEEAGSSCEDGKVCNGADFCDGDGRCNVHPNSPCPGADDDGNCAESCSDLLEGCVAPDPNGSPCDDGVFCNGDDACTNGVCGVHSGDPCQGADGDFDCTETCNEATDACTAADPDGSDCDDNKFCNGDDQCSGGSCSLHAGDPCPGADGDSDCSERCAELVNACEALDPNGSSCVDGLFCNGADACSNGVCSQHAGGACPGPDGDGNCAESCNEQTDSCAAADTNGSPCDDGLFCNGADFCSGGICSQHAGSPCPGADGDGNCAEACNETSDACTAPDPNGSACNDGLFCNGADQCSGGVCSTHAGSPCPGADGDSNCKETCSESADACTASDPNGSACNDGLFCNGTDTCSSGACSVHQSPPCNGADGDGNCSESCNEANDTCSAADPNGSACNDGLFCNGTDSCSSGACTQHQGSPCPGADGDNDCSESCSDSAGGCTGDDPEGSPCNDGVFCNGADFCANGTCSVHAGNPCAGPDGDGNCAEVCSEAADACSAPDPNGSVCNDGVFCNGTDQCSGGLCSVHSGNPCPGADGDGNCKETCSEAADACTASDPNGSACTDGLFCNGTDTCVNGNCSNHAGSPCPGPDGDGNCVESCNETADSCNAADPDGSACSDSVFCNGADKCSGGACSVHPGNPCAGPDGDGNCSESCNEAADACNLADPNGIDCNDGVFCNGADYCSAGACSSHAGNPCAGPDGDLNCSETCNESGDSCNGADPNGSACNDGLICNGADTCVGGSCSGHVGSSCDGPDGDANCSESCSDATGGCTNPDPDGTPCNDGVFCNGADFCFGGSCSVHTTNPCAGPDGDGNCSETCNEAADACNAPDPNGSACNDGLFCNGADTCSGGTCSDHAGTPCPGVDGDGNCSESCNEAADSCSAADPNGSTCSDDLFCNGTDTCTGGACAAHSGSPCSGADGDDNCSESCNEAADLCSAADPEQAACDDGVFCNGADKCIAGVCSSHAGNPCPGADGDGNCSESCNENTDGCTAADPGGSGCDDGLFCNGADTCAAGKCNVHAGTPCSGVDGDIDCSETCSEADDACTAADPDGSACNDGLACTGAKWMCAGYGAGR